jgi:hypothetical protein
MNDSLRLSKCSGREYVNVASLRITQSVLFINASRIGSIPETTVIIKDMLSQDGSGMSVFFGDWDMEGLAGLVV